MRADLRTVLRAAMYLNLMLIFVVPRFYVPFVIVSQVGIVIALQLLRRRRRPQDPYNKDEAIHPR